MQLDFTLNTIHHNNIMDELGDFIKDKRLDCDIRTYSGCIQYTMDGDDFNTFIYRYFNLNLHL